MELYKKEDYEKFIKAGNITAHARDYGASLIKVGASLLEVTEAVEKKITELGGSFAFPPQISINDIAAHYCAEPEDKILFKKDDIVKLDVGATFEGYVGDTAITVDLGDNKKLVEASKNALENAIKIIKPGTTLGEVGKTIQETIIKYGYSPIRNLCGHGVGKYIFHGPPTVPNINTNDKTTLQKGQVIAIEPFATNGAGMIYDSGTGNIYAQINKKPVRNIVTRQVLAEIEKYKSMPFTTRWLARKFPIFKVRFALRDLLNYELLREFPPLVEKEHGIVSQAEHTVIVDDPVIVTTKI